MINELIHLGLTQEEAKVYLAALELGGSYASNIARKAGVNRATCYHTLHNLMEKGLLSSYTRQKALWFTVVDPHRIVELLQEKMKLAGDLLPQLLGISNTLAFKPKIRFFEGVDGVKNIFEDIVKTKEKEILGYTNIATLGHLFPDYFRDYCRRKIQRKLKTRYISPASGRVNTSAGASGSGRGVEVIDQFYPKNYDRNLVEILLVNQKEFFFENEISIYENKVAIFSLNPEEVIGILIESPTFAKSMRSIFNLAWLGATAFVAR